LRPPAAAGGDGACADGLVGCRRLGFRAVALNDRDPATSYGYLTAHGDVGTTRVRTDSNRTSPPRDRPFRTRHRTAGARTKLTCTTAQGGTVQSSPTSLALPHLSGVPDRRRTFGSLSYPGCWTPGSGLVFRRRPSPRWRVTVLQADGVGGSGVWGFRLH
jgi:hypothetical protein